MHVSIPILNIKYVQGDAAGVGWGKSCKELENKGGS